MASPPSGSTASRASTHRCGRYLACVHKDQQRWGGVSTDTRSSQAQYVSRTALDTGREGRLLRPIRAPPSPNHAVQHGQPKRRSRAYQPRASQPEIRPRRECGQLDVAASPGYQGHRLGRRLERHISRHMGEALPALGRLDLPPARNRGSQPPGSISQPRRPARRAGRAGRPRLFGGCLGRLLLAVRHSKVPRVPLRADLPLRGPHAHQRGAQIHPPLAPTAARRHSSGRQPMHLIDERPPEPRSNRGMDLIAVQASLHP